MQQEQQTAAQQRQQSFAKLLECEGHQVLVYLIRDEADALGVVLQMWVAHTDEQLRAHASVETDEQAMEMFNSINAEAIDDVVKQIGLLEIIEDLV